MKSAGKNKKRIIVSSPEHREKTKNESKLKTALVTHSSLELFPFKKSDCFLELKKCCYVVAGPNQAKTGHSY